MQSGVFLGDGKEADQVCVRVYMCVCVCTYMYVTAGVQVGGEGGREGLRGKLRNDFIFYKMEIRAWWFMATITMNIRVSPGEEPWEPQVSF